MSKSLSFNLSFALSKLWGIGSGRFGSTLPREAVRDGFSDCFQAPLMLPLLSYESRLESEVI